MCNLEVRVQLFGRLQLVSKQPLSAGTETNILLKMGNNPLKYVLGRSIGLAVMNIAEFVEQLSLESLVKMALKISKMNHYSCNNQGNLY